MVGFQGNVNFSLNYSKMLLLDAEDVAEGGIKEAYDRLAPDRKSHVSEVVEVGQVVDSDAPSYIVEVRGVEYVTLSPAVPEEDGSSWGRATEVLFKIVSDQLADSDYRLYAINGGNDLGGILLTRQECEAARLSLRRKQDWPYLPTLEDPSYGQFHD